MGKKQRKTSTELRTEALNLLGSTHDEAEPSSRLMLKAPSPCSSARLNLIRDMLLLPPHRVAIELCEKLFCFLGASGIQDRSPAQVFFGCRAVAALQLDFAGMSEHVCVLNSDRKDLLNLLFGFSILSVGVERPGIGVEGEHVVTPGNFALCDLKSLGGLACEIDVVEGQLVVRIISAMGFGERLLLELRKGFLRLCYASRELQGFSQIEQILRVRSRPVPLLQERDCFSITMLLDAHLCQIAERVVVAGEHCERLVQQLLGIGRIALGELQMSHLRQDPCSIFSLAGLSRVEGHLHQLKRTFHVAVELAQVGGSCQAGQVCRTKL